MIEVRDVAQVRAAERRAMDALPDGVLMQRAAYGLALACVDVLRGVRGRVTGARVVLLVGSGSNGGDALWAGTRLLRRGCKVDAVALGDRIHSGGASAFRAAGGRVRRWSPLSGPITKLVADADIAVDGIVGIGGSGGLRDDAAEIVEAVHTSGAVVVAVDLPSGVDADTGAVSGYAVSADITVTFGFIKPGLIVAPGRFHAGSIRLVDIGLADYVDEPPVARILQGRDVASWLVEPSEDGYKYRRGVVGLTAGSSAYPGAALLSVDAARHGNVGMVRFLDRSDGVARSVVQEFPDIVVDGAEPVHQSRVGAWACGPGFTGDNVDTLTVEAVLLADVPIVLDAGALAVVARHSEARALIADRNSRGLVTVLTPHDGEFERLAPGLLDSGTGRVAAAQEAARSLGAVVLLKGPGTIIASPDGSVLLDDEGTADLSTAGSGDVLTGVIGALLAGAWAEGRRDRQSLTEAVAAAAWVHGVAGRIAGKRGPVLATDIAAAIPAAVGLARFGEEAG